MSEILQFFNDTLQPLIIIFTVSSLAVMGLQVKSAEVVPLVVKQPRTLVAIIVWGWVAGAGTRLTDRLG